MTPLIPGSTASLWVSLPVPFSAQANLVGVPFILPARPDLPGGFVGVVTEQNVNRIKLIQAPIQRVVQRLTASVSKASGRVRASVGAAETGANCSVGVDAGALPVEVSFGNLDVNGDSYIDGRDSQVWLRPTIDVTFTIQPTPVAFSGSCSFGAKADIPFALGPIPMLARLDSSASVTLNVSKQSQTRSVTYELGAYAAAGPRGVDAEFIRQRVSPDSDSSGSSSESSWAWNVKVGGSASVQIGPGIGASAGGLGAGVVAGMTLGVSNDMTLQTEPGSTWAEPGRTCFVLDPKFTLNYGLALTVFFSAGFLSGEWDIAEASASLPVTIPPGKTKILCLGTQEAPDGSVRIGGPPVERSVPAGTAEFSVDIKGVKSGQWLQLSGTGPSGRWELYDSNGRFVDSDYSSQGSFSITVLLASSRPSGTYVLRIDPTSLDAATYTVGASSLAYPSVSIDSNPRSLSTTYPGQVLLQTIAGVKVGGFGEPGEWLQLSGTGPSGRWELYDSNGRFVDSDYSSQGSFSITVLLASSRPSGTYVLRIRPTSLDAATYTVGASSLAYPSVSVDGNPRVVSTTYPGQVLLQSIAGVKVGGFGEPGEWLQLSGTGPSGRWELYDSNGRFVDSDYSSQGSFSITVLLASSSPSGTYVLRIRPTSLDAATYTVGASGPTKVAAAVNGAPRRVATDFPGQALLVPITGVTSGDSLALSGTGPTGTWTLYDSNGRFVDLDYSSQGSFSITALLTSSSPSGTYVLKIRPTSLDAATYWVEAKRNSS